MEYTEAWCGELNSLVFSVVCFYLFAFGTLSINSVNYVLSTIRII
jgi:hypothetical protein